MFKGSRNRLIVKVHLAEVDVRPDLGDTVLHLRDGVHQHVMAAPFLNVVQTQGIQFNSIVEINLFQMDHSQECSIY